MTSGTLAKAEDVNANFDGVDAGMDLIEAEVNKSIQVTNAPGIVDVALNAAARANKTLSFDVNGDLAASQDLGTFKGNHVDAAGTAYVLRDIVIDSFARIGLDNLYICSTAHTSTGTILVDTANWTLLLDSAQAMNWASKVDGIVDATDYSSRAYAIGGTGVTGAAAKGHAKDWATKVNGTADDAEHSAKAYAVGGTGVSGVAAKGAAKEWATKTDGSADDAEQSAKAYAIGGTGVTATVGKGAAKEWATSVGAEVDTAEWSAKEYALGTAVPEGSAKDWALQAEDSAVDGVGFSALHWAAKAATSFDDFDDRFLGAKANPDPTLDNDGNALLTGALYWNTTISKLKIYNGAAFEIISANAVDVTVTDAGGHLAAVEVEAALAEIAVLTKHLTVSQAVNLDTMESNIATNNSKNTNANHTGDVTGENATTLQAVAISGKTDLPSGIAGTDEILVNDSGVLKRLDLNNLISGMATTLSSALAGTDEILVSDAGLIKKMDISVMNAYFNANLTVANNALAAHSHTAGEISALDASDTTTGTFGDARIPNLNASKITAGTFAAARIPSLDASKITTGLLGASRIPTHTGDATGQTALTLQPSAISGKTNLSSGILGTDELLVNDGGVLKRLDLNNLISGMSGALTSGLATTDEILVSDAGSIKRMDISVFTAHLVANAHTWSAKQDFNAEVALNGGYSEDADQYTATTGTRTLNTAVATYFYPSADLGAAVITFVFSNPAATGRVTSFTMELLGADGATLTWPTSVDWPSAIEPAWTSGRDLVTFVTRDGGTTWYGFAAGLDMA